MPLVKAYSVANLASNGVEIFQSKGQGSLSLAVLNGPGLGGHSLDDLLLAVLFPASLVQFLG